MFQRTLRPSRASSFFLFGARGTGKSTFVNKQFKMERPWVLDLLDPEIENYYARSPKRLELELMSKRKKPDWVVIDEIQKVPKLLDVAHRLIENHRQKFILTGSSARKLKRGAANLLAGRAFLYHLFPLTALELNDRFDLSHHLQWGSLPQLYSYTKDKDRAAFLRGYTLNYLNQEIRIEQLVRRLDPFRSFLEIAGTCSGRVINHKKIGEQVGVDTKTIQSYFQIMEDTLVGFYLPGFHGSVRKSQKINPKFFIFDGGVKKALEGSLDQKVVPRTSVYGLQFEAMVILEIYRMNEYFCKGYKASYFATRGGAEVDLVLSKANKHQLIEIKSSDHIDETEVDALGRLAKDFPGSTKAFYLSQDSHAFVKNGVQCMHWLQYLKAFAN